MTLAPGENIGPYRIIDQLGQGGMATVFKAYHAALDRYVAIKVLHPAFKEDPSFLARFHREARIVAKLDHPNITPIYDFAEYQGTPYLVIRYIEGQTLKVLLRDGLLPLDGVLAIMRPITDALAYAHAQGVLHRDIKPSNIMIANDRHIYLSDFGLARMAQTGESTLSQDMLIGTPQYISPEQAKGTPVDPRSDIYSLGVVLFEMLTGRVPFSADTPYAVIHDHIYAPLPLPTSINPNLSLDLERVLLKALAKEPDARFDSATDLMAALARAAGDAAPAAPTLTPPPTPILREPTPPPAAREPRATPAPPLARATVPPPIAPKAGRRISPGVLAIAGVIVLIFFIVCCALAWSQRDSIQRLVKTWQQQIVQPTGVLRRPTGVGQPTDVPKDVRATVKASQDPALHVQMGDTLARQKDFEAAFEEYDRAIKLDPKSPNAYLHAGELAEKLGDLDRAAKYYQAGRDAFPGNMDLLLALGDLLAKQNKWEDARTAYEKALRLDPNSAQALWRLGDYYRAQGKSAEALREYTRALAIDPDLPEAHYGLGMLAMQRGANDEAKRQFQMVINNSDAPADLKERATKQLRTLSGK
jgi:serine/threonine-protein kinase